MKGTISQLGITASPGFIRKRKPIAEATETIETDVPEKIYSAPKSLYKIKVIGLEIMANIGIYSHEKIAEQPLILDIIVSMIDSFSPQSDDIKETLDYDYLVEIARDLALKKHYNLLESYADAISSRILNLRMVKGVKLIIKKPNAIKGAIASEIELERFI